MTVKLDGRPSSLLDFKSARIEALKKIAIGEKIIWELDLGLSLPATPHSVPANVHSQILAVDHFLETLWAEFHNYTGGLCVYRGSINYDLLTLPDILKLVSANIPDRLMLPLYFEGDESLSLELAKKTSRALFPRFEILWNGKKSPFRSLETNVGFLIPSDAEDAFSVVLSQNKEVRVVDEAFLTGEWEGLDTLFVTTAFVTKEGLRKLKGFNAAGGEVITIGNSLNLAIEKSFAL